MITTKYNFKLWLKRKYPDVIANPVYGVPAYLLSKALSTEDMYLYNVQQLPSGQYIVFSMHNFSNHSVNEKVTSRRTTCNSSTYRTCSSYNLFIIRTMVTTKQHCSSKQDIL